MKLILSNLIKMDTCCFCRSEFIYDKSYEYFFDTLGTMLILLLTLIIYGEFRSKKQGNKSKDQSIYQSSDVILQEVPNHSHLPPFPKVIINSYWIKIIILILIIIFCLLPLSEFFKGSS